METQMILPADDVEGIKSTLRRIMKKPSSGSTRKKNDGTLSNENDDFVARLSLQDSEKAIFSRIFFSQPLSQNLAHEIFIQTNVEQFLTYFFGKCFFGGLSDLDDENPSFSKQNFSILEVIFEFPDYFSYWFRWISLFLVDEHCLKVIAQCGFSGMFWFVFSKTENFPREILHTLLRFVLPIICVSKNKENTNPIDSCLLTTFNNDISVFFKLLEDFLQDQNKTSSSQTTEQWKPPGLEDEEDISIARMTLLFLVLEKLLPNWTSQIEKDEKTYLETLTNSWNKFVVTVSVRILSDETMQNQSCRLNNLAQLFSLVEADAFDIKFIEQKDLFFAFKLMNSFFYHIKNSKTVNKLSDLFINGSAKDKEGKEMSCFNAWIGLLCDAVANSGEMLHGKLFCELVKFLFNFSTGAPFLPIYEKEKKHQQSNSFGNKDPLMGGSPRHKKLNFGLTQNSPSSTTNKSNLANIGSRKFRRFTFEYLTPEEILDLFSANFDASLEVTENELYLILFLESLIWFEDSQDVPFQNTVRNSVISAFSEENQNSDPSDQDIRQTISAYYQKLLNNVNSAEPQKKNDVISLVSIQSLLTPSLLNENFAKVFNERLDSVPLSVLFFWLRLLSDPSYMAETQNDVFQYVCFMTKTENISFIKLLVCILEALKKKIYSNHQNEFSSIPLKQFAEFGIFYPLIKIFTTFSNIPSSNNLESEKTQLFEYLIGFFNLFFEDHTFLSTFQLNSQPTKALISILLHQIKKYTNYSENGSEKTTANFSILDLGFTLLKKMTSKSISVLQFDANLFYITLLEGGILELIMNVFSLLDQPSKTSKKLSNFETQQSPNEEPEFEQEIDENKEFFYGIFKRCLQILYKLLSNEVIMQIIPEKTGTRLISLIVPYLRNGQYYFAVNSNVSTPSTSSSLMSSNPNNNPFVRKIKPVNLNLKKFKAFNDTDAEIDLNSGNSSGNNSFIVAATQTPALNGQIPPILSVSSMNTASSMISGTEILISTIELGLNVIYLLMTDQKHGTQKNQTLLSRLSSNCAYNNTLKTNIVSGGFLSQNHNLSIEIETKFGEDTSNSNNSNLDDEAFKEKMRNAPSKNTEGFSTNLLLYFLSFPATNTKIQSHSLKILSIISLDKEIREELEIQDIEYYLKLLIASDDYSISLNAGSVLNHFAETKTPEPEIAIETVEKIEIVANKQENTTQEQQQPQITPIQKISSPKNIEITSKSPKNAEIPSNQTKTPQNVTENSSSDAASARKSLELSKKALSATMNSRKSVINFGDLKKQIQDTYIDDNLKSLRRITENESLSIELDWEFFDKQIVDEEGIKATKTIRKVKTIWENIREAFSKYFSQELPVEYSIYNFLIREHNENSIYRLVFNECVSKILVKHGPNLTMVHNKQDKILEYTLGSSEDEEDQLGSDSIFEKLSSLFEKPADEYIQKRIQKEKEKQKQPPVAKGNAKNIVIPPQQKGKQLASPKGMQVATQKQVLAPANKIESIKSPVSVDINSALLSPNDEELTEDELLRQLQIKAVSCWESEAKLKSFAYFLKDKLFQQSFRTQADKQYSAFLANDFQTNGEQFIKSWRVERFSKSGKLREVFLCLTNKTLHLVKYDSHKLKVETKKSHTLDCLVCIDVGRFARESNVTPSSSSSNLSSMINTETMKAFAVHFSTSPMSVQAAKSKALKKSQLSSSSQMTKATSPLAITSIPASPVPINGNPNAFLVANSNFEGFSNSSEDVHPNVSKCKSEFFQIPKDYPSSVLPITVQEIAFAVFAVSSRVQSNAILCKPFFNQRIERPSRTGLGKIFSFLK